MLFSTGHDAAPQVEIPGLGWDLDEIMGEDIKEVPQKEDPYDKAIPALF